MVKSDARFRRRDVLKIAGLTPLLVALPSGPAQCQGWEIVGACFVEIGKGMLAALGTKIVNDAMGWGAATPQDVKEIVAAAVEEIKRFVTQALVENDITMITGALWGNVQILREYETAGGLFRLEHVLNESNILIAQLSQFGRRSFLIQPVAVSLKLFAQIYYARETKNRKEIEIYSKIRSDAEAQLTTWRRELWDDFANRSNALNTLQKKRKWLDYVQDTKYNEYLCWAEFTFDGHRYREQNTYYEPPRYNGDECRAHGIIDKKHAEISKMMADARWSWSTNIINPLDVLIEQWKTAEGSILP